MQTFLHQLAERGTFLSGHAPNLIQQFVGKLYGGLHTGHPYQRCGDTLSPMSALGKPRTEQIVFETADAKGWFAAALDAGNDGEKGYSPEVRLQ